MPTQVRNTCTKKEYLERLAKDRFKIIANENEFDGGLGLLGYTDGGLDEATGKAGWGFGVFDRNGVVIHEQYGPVVTDTSSAHWLGATEHTNNTGELSAAGEMCIWWDKWGSQIEGGALEWRYDSTLTADAVLGRGVSHANQTLVNTIKCCFRACVRGGLIAKHVFSHTGVFVGNNLADKLAEYGQKGSLTKGGRYAEGCTTGLDIVPWARAYERNEGTGVWDGVPH